MADEISFNIGILDSEVTCMRTLGSADIFY